MTQVRKEKEILGIHIDIPDYAPKKKMLKWFNKIIHIYTKAAVTKFICPTEMSSRNNPDQIKINISLQAFFETTSRPVSVIWK